jgi:hypothetical protein
MQRASVRQSHHADEACLQSGYSNRGKIRAGSWRICQTYTLKVADASGVDWSSKIKWPIIDSKSKGKAFLHFIFKLSSARELITSRDNGPTLISKFELRLQGSYQTDWKDILDATDPNDERNIKFYEEQVQNMLSDIFAKDEWS